MFGIHQVEPILIVLFLSASLQENKTRPVVSFNPPDKR